VISLGGQSIDIPCNAPVNFTRPYSFLPTATCQPFQKTKYSQCSNVVSWKTVYIQEGQTQAALDFQAWKSTYPFTYLTVPRECSVAMLRFVCSGIFLSCHTYPIPSTPQISGTLCLLVYRIDSTCTFLIDNSIDIDVCVCVCVCVWC
jgi:hypothetical protein